MSMIDLTDEELGKLTKNSIIVVLKAVCGQLKQSKVLMRNLSQAMLLKQGEQAEAYVARVQSAVNQVIEIIDAIPGKLDKVVGDEASKQSKQKEPKEKEEVKATSSKSSESPVQEGRHRELNRSINGSDFVNRAYKLDSNTPIFGDKKLDTIDEWIFAVNNSMFAANIPEEIKLSVVTPYLRGLPLQLLKKYQQDNGVDADWYEFCAFLAEQFKPRDWQTKLRLQLRDLKQNESFESYLLKFQTIVNQIDDISETDQVLWFSEGLRPKARYEVKSKNAKTLDEAIIIASTYENCFGNNQVGVNYANKVNNNYRKNYNYNRNTNTSFSDIKLRGNFNRNKPVNDRFKPNTSTITLKSSKDYVKTVRCFKCNRNGHYANKCDSKLSSGFKQEYKRPKTVAMCDLVEEDEEVKQPRIIAMCERSNESILKIEGLINGAKANCALDIGAVESIVSKRWVDANNIVINSSDVQIKTATNEITTVIGETNELIVDVEGHTCKLSFLILDMNDHEVLLGLNWFNKTGAGVFPADNVLRFPGKVIHLNKDFNYSELDESRDILLSEVADDEDIAGETDWMFSDVKVTPEEKLDNDLLRRFGKLIKKYEDRLAKGIDDLGECSIGEHVISLTDEKPIYQQPYRKAAKEREELALEINKMIEAKIIRASQSAWSSPVILIPKKDGSKRMCIDYRKLNTITKQVNWPIPRIADILDGLSGSMWFTTLDLKAGYWQLKLDPKSIEKTAFSTPDGHYEFLRLPFGLKNAPAVFSQLMHRVFGNLSFVKIYLDDITIHSKTADEHFEHLEIVFQRLRDINLKLNHEKCIWFAKKIRILGYIINEGVVTIDNRHIAAIQERVPPKNIKQVQQYLGLCNYYRKFIKDYAKISSPIYQLLHKEVKFEWTKECQDTFEILNKKLTSTPTLRLPDFSKEFTLYTDASGFALGAILSQTDENGNEYVCSYASRLLKNAEVHYGITEKECLAVVWSIKQFRIYLYGKKFRVVTDHAALSWLMKINDPTGRLARWSIYLQAYEFDIVHRRGRIHSNVDAVSRPVLLTEIKGEEETEDVSSKFLDPYEDEALLHYLKHGKNLDGLSKKQTKRVNKLASIFAMKNDLIYLIKDNKSKLVPRPEERRKLIEKAHVIGHFQAASTYCRLKEEYWWKNMVKDVIGAVKQCTVCQRHQKVTALNHPANAIKVNGIFDRIGIDLVFGLPETKDGFKGLLVITEYLTKYPYVEAIKSKSAEEIAEKLWKYIAIFGPPKIILSDQGNEFNNQLVNKLITAVGAEHKITSAYNPRTNGMTERFNQTVIESLRKHTEKEPDEWPKWIPFVSLAYRSRVHSVTNFTPFELLFGRKMNNFEDWKNKSDDQEDSELFQRSVELRDLVFSLHQEALINIENNQEKQKEIQDKSHTVVHENLPIGTSVFVKEEGLKGKLEARYAGPYKVRGVSRHNNYYLTDSDGIEIKKTYPLHKLKVVETPTNATEESFEIDKVIDKRVSGTGIEYLVKWKDCPDSENSWIKEENFNSSEPIKLYEASIRGVEIVKKKVGRPSKKKVNPLLLVALLFINYFLTGVAGLAVKDQFKYCDYASPDESFLDVRSSCFNSKSKVVEGHSRLRKYHLLNKVSNLVFGNGYECQKEVVEITLKKNFFGETSKSTNSYYAKLSKGECNDMILTKKCEGQEMSCDESSCFSKNIPSDEYKWMSTINQLGYICSIKPRVISGEKLTTKLIKPAISACTAEKFYCQLRDSIVVWDKNIINNCSYEYISNGFYKSIEDNLLMDNVSTHVFQIKAQLDACNMEIYSTQEGLFLTTDSNAEKLRKGENKIKILNELIFSEIDKNYYESYVKNKEIYAHMCSYFMALVKSLANIEDKYLIMTSYNDDEIILYSGGGNLFVPACLNIEEIRLEKTANCFEDLPVSFKINESVIHGFLDTNRIIKKSSKMIDCFLENHNKFILLKYKNRIIKRINNTFRIDYLKESNFKRINVLNSKPGKFNTHHDLLFNDGFSLISELKNLINIQDKNNLLSIEKGDFLKKFESSNFKETLEALKNKIWSNKSLLIVFAACLLCTSLVTIVVMFLIKKLKTKSRKFCFSSKNNKKFKFRKRRASQGDVMSNTDIPLGIFDN